MSKFLKKYSNVLLITFILISFIFVFQSCVTLVTYTPLHDELPQISNGVIHFQIQSLDRQNIMDRFYPNYDADPEKSYWSISILHRYKHPAIPMTNLKVDSIYIWFEEGSKNEFTSLDSNTHKYSLSRYTNIEPIGIPKKYKGDFYVRFILSIYDISSNELTDRLPITLHCKRGRILNQDAVFGV